MRVGISDLRVCVGSATLLDDVSLEVRPGELLGLLGRNGSGKSTLLRTIYRMLRPTTGIVRLDDDDLWSLSARESARRVGVVTQEQGADFDLDVVAVVLMGRTPHQGSFARDSEHDLAVVRDALRRVNADQLADRMITTLSGGERQRVLLARALAQETSVLLLDEPTNHLDIAHQLDLLGQVRALGTTTVAALHDLNLAAEYCDRVAVLSEGHVVAVGTPSDVLTPRLLVEAFGVRADRVTHPRTGRLLFAFSTSTYAGPTSPSADASGNPHVTEGLAR